MCQELCWGYSGGKRGHQGPTLLEPVGKADVEQLCQHLCRAWLVGDFSPYLPNDC